MTGYQVRLARFSSGERLPFLVDLVTGLPEPDVMSWVLERLRLRGLSFNTIEFRLRSLSIALTWCRENEIGLKERISSSIFLSPGEMLALWDALRCRLPIPSGSPGDIKSSSIVDEQVHIMRLRTFRDFVRWECDQSLHKLRDIEWNYAIERLEKWSESWRALFPRSRSTDRIKGERFGLTQEQRQILLRAIHPDSPENPFSLRHRHRNFALLSIYFDLGVRLSEALAIKISDLNLRGSHGEVTIHRRHDDPEDPRVRQPQVKTLPRILDMNDGCRDALEDWLFEHRSDLSRYSKAKRSPYLFVSERGEPLSIRSAKHIFEILRSRTPGLGATFSAHVLRHDWNERWIELLVKRDKTNDTEYLKAQSYRMGWTAESRMPKRYTKRATRALSSRFAVFMADGVRQRSQEESEWLPLPHS
jgi:integrase